MPSVKMSIIFFLLWFISATSCHFSYITECEKHCPIESTAGFDEDQASGVLKNLSLCLDQYECFNDDDCSAMLTKWYCHYGNCTVTCKLGMIVHYEYILQCYIALLLV